MVLCRPGGRGVFILVSLFLLLLSVVLPSFFGLSSEALPGVWRSSGGWRNNDTHGLFFSDVDPNCACSDLHLLVSKFV